MNRRHFLHALGTLPALAAYPPALRELLAETAPPQPIVAVEILKLTGSTQALRGVNQQHQVQMLHLYPEHRPEPYRDAPAPQRVQQTVDHYYLRIRTQDGLQGVYGYVDWDAVPAILGRLRPLIMGQDALAVEQLWDKMYRSNRHSRAGHFMMALSYVDNALWDLRGRYFNVPVYQLLGGPTRHPAQVYGSCLGFSVEPEAAAQKAAALKAQGFMHQKWFLAYGPGDGPAGLQKNIELVRALREAVGWDVELMFDAYMGWDLPFARAWVDGVAAYRPAWIEEAFPMADLESFIQLSRTTPFPVATGEHFYNRWEVQTFLKAGAIQVVQADPEWCGGVSELVKICHLASVHGAKVVPHGHNIHAALHVVASQSPAVCPLVEYLINHMPGKVHFQKDPLLTDNGQLALPTGPGFGIELDDDKIEDVQVLTSI